MPANIVKTPEDEGYWERAKAAARKTLKESDPGFYALATDIFKKIKAKHSKKGKKR